MGNRGVDEGMSGEYVIKSGNLVIGIDAASNDDKGVAVAMMLNADGTMTVVGHKELFAAPVQPYDLDLTAQDVTDQRALPKP